MATPFEPVPADERITTLDVLRGAALLGILLMNVLTFGLPFAAYANPRLWGGDQGANLWTFVVHWVLFEGKMRALFSMIFGAGILLFMQRATARDSGVRAADLYCRRMLWLAAFGVVHAWLIWAGDILYAYGLCGLLIFPVRTASPKALFATAGSVLLLITALIAGEGFHERSMRNEATAAGAAKAQGHALTKEQQEAKKQWADKLSEFEPSREEMQQEIDDYRGGYVATFWRNAKIVKKFTFVPMYLPSVGDFWGLMLVGMGLFKLGVLQGERPVAVYVRMAIVGYAIGVPLNAMSAYGMVSSGFDPVAMTFWNTPHQIGRVSVALAHAAVVVILVKKARVAGLTARLAAVGQMALSNYISHSVICALLFYSPGLRLIGHLQRYQLYFVVAAIWVFNLTWSPWWLRRYRFGPLEWCWRSLTYWKRQPMRRQASSPITLVVTPR